jgi:uncharacterized protein (UPF0335 family)
MNNLELVLQKIDDLANEVKDIKSDMKEIKENIFFPSGIIQNQNLLDVRVKCIEETNQKHKENISKYYWLAAGVVISSPTLMLILHFFSV